MLIDVSFSSLHVEVEQLQAWKKIVNVQIAVNVLSHKTDINSNPLFKSHKFSFINIGANG